MLRSYIFIIVSLGCTVSSSFVLDVRPDYHLCSYNCSGNFNCTALGMVEWLYPNFSVISNMDITAKIYVQNNILSFNNPDVSDAGNYICRSNSNSFTAELIVKVFMYSNSPQLYEVKTTLRYHDTLINCSVLPTNTVVLWKHKNTYLISNNSDKYTQNISGLIIYNVTNEDRGQYECSVDHLLQAFITLNVIWGPELLSQQNQTLKINAGEVMILNCTVSASPNPVYSWSFPDSCSSCPNFSNDSVLIFTARSNTDSGEYTCVAENEYGSLSVTFNVNIIAPLRFVFNNDSVLLEERFTLLGSDVFINCSVNYGTEYNITSWLFNDEPLLINQTSRFSQNTSGLTVFNVTKLDEGNYTCHVDQLWGVVLMHVEWPPVLVSKQIQKVVANISEQVILNCTVSASPDPVYNWSFPDSCSSCPNTSNDSVLIFTAEDITDSGEYVCVAENKYGNISKGFNVTVVSPLSVDTDPHHEITIIMKQRSNILLTCDHPTPDINWTITTPLSGLYIMQNNYNNNSEYKLYSNGSIEIYYQFLVKKSYIIVKCLAFNPHRLYNQTFNLWEHEIFTKKQDFRLYVKNFTNCLQIEKGINRIFRELVHSIQRWFNSVCDCDGYNNLHHPKLTCVNDKTGIITSTVHRDGLLSAQELIDLASADIQRRNPPVVHLSHGWILCLNESEPKIENDNNASQAMGISLLIAVSVASLCTVLAFLLCVTIGIVYMKYKRQETKTSKTEEPPHFYEDLDAFLTTLSESTNGNKSGFTRDEIVFDATTAGVQPNNEVIYDTADNTVQSLNKEDSLDDITEDYIQLHASVHQSTTTKPPSDDWKFQCNYEIMNPQNNA